MKNMHSTNMQSVNCKYALIDPEECQGGAAQYQQTQRQVHLYRDITIKLILTFKVFALVEITVFTNLGILVPVM